MEGGRAGERRRFRFVFGVGEAGGRVLRGVGAEPPTGVVSTLQRVLGSTFRLLPAGAASVVHRCMLHLWCAAPFTPPRTLTDSSRPHAVVAGAAGDTGPVGQGFRRFSRTRQVGGRSPLAPLSPRSFSIPLSIYCLPFPTSVSHPARAFPACATQPRTQRMHIACGVGRRREGAFPAWPEEFEGEGGLSRWQRWRPRWR